MGTHGEGLSGAHDDDGDGLPNQVGCAGGSMINLSGTPSVGSTCSTLQTLTTFSGCAFTIKIFMGSHAANDDGAGNPADCSGIDHPMTFFGGPEDDKFIGTAHGDFFNGGIDSDEIHGGGGPDFICVNQDEADANEAYGDGGADLVWGGPDDDYCYGGSGPDLVHGAVQNDHAFGDAGDDYVHGGSDPDTCDGGDDLDNVHTGEADDPETVIADDTLEDVVFAADDEQDDITGDYPEADTCFYDAADGLDVADACDVELSRVVCTTEHPFVVATLLDDDPDEARLFELEVDGDIGGSGTQQGLVWIPGEEAYAQRIVALAIPPDDCDTLAAIVVHGGDQFLAKIDLGAEPAFDSGAGQVVYSTYDFDAITSSVSLSALVGIGYDFASRLGGLTDEAEFVSISASGSLDLVGLVGPNDQWDGGTFVPRGYRLAFDDPDGGLFISLVEDPNPDGYIKDGEEEEASLVAMVAYHPETTYGTPQEDHIFEEAGNIPFTVTNAGYGHFFTLAEENTNHCGAGEFAYTKIRRRNFEFSNWNEWGCPGPDPNPSPPDEPVYCCAPLGVGVVVDAITIPHYVGP